MVIAHRLSTIKDSSKIVAFEKGRVFEEGTHDDLLKNDNSLYRKLWDRQLAKRGGDDETEQEEEEGDTVEPLPVEAGMNPKPSGLRRLETLLQDLPDSDPNKKEIQHICEMLETEQKGRDIRHRGIQKKTLDVWTQRMQADTHLSSGTKNFKRLANKVIFKKLHSEISEALKSVDSHDDEDIEEEYIATQRASLSASRRSSIGDSRRNSIGGSRRSSLRMSVNVGSES